VKIVNSGLNSLKVFGKETAAQFRSEDLRAATKAARELGLGSMIHVNGRSPVHDAVAAGCQSIEHGFFMGPENLELMAERQTFWAPTAFSMRAYADLLERDSIESIVSAANLDHQIHQLSLARKLGVAVVVGTDSGGYGIDHGAAFAGELGILLEAGYSIEEAIRCAAWNGARLLKLENELGVLRVGMPATFVVVDGGPESLPYSLSRPNRIYVQGNLISKFEIFSTDTFLPDERKDK
jgi:imidazolonepropionase-like amidohydrolase